MKAYKASYNGVCRGNFKYEVGQTYEITNIKICHRGFHACKKMSDTLQYYAYYKNFVLFEVELLGKVIEGDDKVVTNKIKIIRIVPPEEYDGFKVDNRGNLIYRKHYNGYEWWREYDERNNCIHHKDSVGTEYYKKYDVHDNLIHFKASDGTEWWKEYDEHNNLIHFKHPDGRKYRVKQKYFNYL